MMETRSHFWERNDIFKKKCPTLCRILANAEQGFAESIHGVESESNTAKDDAVDNVAEILSVKDCGENLYLLADANFRQEKAVIFSGIEIVDESSGTVYATAYQDGYDTTDLYVEILKKLDDIKNLMPSDSRLRADIHFLWSDKSGNVEESEDSYSVDEMGLKDVVSGLQVEEPRAADRKQTVILYARVPYAGETPDFSYPDNAADTKTNLVRVQIPVKGSVSIDPKWEIEELIFENPESKEMRTKLLLSLEGGGQVEYNQGVYEDTGLFTVDKENGKIMFQTKHKTADGETRKGDADSWNVNLDISRFSVKTTVRLVLNLVVLLHNKENPLIKREVCIVVNSSQVQAGESALTIEPISIRWGCVKQGTQVLMADGEELPIEKIHLDDVVKNGQGRQKKVCSIYKGFEEEFVSVKTESGNFLQMTASHPVMTEGGWKRAGQLCAADKLCIYPSGSTNIKELYMTDERAEVYNLQLEDNEASFITNGLITGTFETQNSSVSFKEEQELSTKARQLQEEIKDFMRTISDRT